MLFRAMSVIPELKPKVGAITGTHLTWRVDVFENTAKKKKKNRRKIQPIRREHQRRDNSQAAVFKREHSAQNV